MPLDPQAKALLDAEARPHQKSGAERSTVYGRDIPCGYPAAVALAPYFWQNPEARP